jgi:hypothetical protein
LGRADCNLNVLYNSAVTPEAAPLQMPLARSSRIFLLLAMLIPAMVFISGCLPRMECCSPEIIDDTSYRSPPYDTLWRWFAKVSQRDSTGREGLPDAYLFELDTSSIASDLNKRLEDDSRATAISFFSSLGMSCAPAGFDVQCERSLPVVYACVHAHPRPDDYKVRRNGNVRIVILVSASGYAVRSAIVAGSGTVKPWC